MNKEEMTMEQRLESADVKTIYPPDFKFSRKEKRWDEIILKYNGIEIMRPSAHSCVKVCEKYFGLEI